MRLSCLVVFVFLRLVGCVCRGVSENVLFVCLGMLLVELRIDFVRDYRCDFIRSCDVLNKNCLLYTSDAADE